MSGNALVRRLPLLPLLLVEALQIVAFLNSATAGIAKGPAIPVAAAISCASAFGLAVAISLRRNPFEALAGYWIAKVASALLFLPFVGADGSGFLPFVLAGWATTGAFLSAAVAGLVHLAIWLLPRRAAKEDAER